MPQHRSQCLFRAAVIVSALALARPNLNAQAVNPAPPAPPRGARLEGPLVRIPSKAAGTQGIWVRIAPPQHPRYADGAPVIVHVPGGFSAGEVDFSPAAAPLHNAGFIELAFLFPGGASGPRPDGKTIRSGGFYDCRGPASVEALADVIAFATGRWRTVDGKTLSECLTGTRALADQVGVIGWSLGGTTIAAALARYKGKVRGLKWYASHESPYGEGVIDGEFGTRLQPNRFYDPETGKLDLSKLRYSADAPVKPMPPAPGTEHLRGALFLDGNSNGVFDQGSDFLFSGIFLPGPPPNLYYSPMLTREARDRKVFGAQWPPHIASVKQAEKVWAIRDGVSNIPKAVKNVPDLAVIIFASVQDHVQATADHLHIRAQYDGFQAAGVRWIRLNPDAHYVEWVLGRRPLRVIQNPAGVRFDRYSIRTALESEPQDGGPTDEEALIAAACELADRTKKGEWGPTLSAVLFPDAPHGMLERPRPPR